MTSTKQGWTAGPWRIDEKRGQNKYGGLSISADGSSPNSLAVAETWDMSGHGDTEANARLIAAAPAMYAALEALVTAHDEQSNCWGCGSHRTKAHAAGCSIGNAQAALALARGEQ